MNAVGRQRMGTLEKKVAKQRKKQEKSEKLSARLALASFCLDDQSPKQANEAQNRTVKIYSIQQHQSRLPQLNGSVNSFHSSNAPSLDLIHSFPQSASAFSSPHERTQIRAIRKNRSIDLCKLSNN
ncbi:Magnesium transport protein CorA [Trichinella spiralis]|uniref:Magnesium transport protein CorA n=1 Tax=Trichinella spiralis TaxID=6334 RepID=A0ABR3KQJ6_TRISP